MRTTGLFLIVCLLFSAAAGCSKDDPKGAPGTFATVGSKIGADGKAKDGHEGDRRRSGGQTVNSSDADGGDAPIASPTEMGRAKTAKTPAVEGDKAEESPSAPTSVAETKMPIAEKAVTKTLESAKTDESAPPPTPPAVAEAVVGREPAKAKATKKEGLPAGILTAGSFDDNVDPAVFSSYVRRMSQRQGLGNLLEKLNGQRIMIIVKDGSGKPVGNARVRLSVGTGSPIELTTRSDGRVVFHLAFDQIGANQPLLASVTGPDGGNPVTETIGSGAQRWEITLPGAQARLPKNLDLAIILDTTGSMGDELEYLKSEIRGISSAIAKKFPEVKQRFALVLYRDEGDAYLVRPFDFTDSLDLFHKRLAEQSAAGGGDEPEAMHKGLQEANQLRWQEDRDTARVAFLIADAPPHAQHMNATLSAVNGLRKKGVALYPVACSGYNADCEFVMRSSAMLTGGQFLFLTDDSGVGNSHAEPTIPYYQVERLERLMIRMIASELSGQHIQAEPADILRTVGKKVN